MAAELAFRAMGTDVHVIVVADAHATRLAAAARRRIDELEQRWSRFLPASEVSELNRHAGRRVAVSADTQELVARAVEAWRISGGLFDPTVLGDVLRAGYDRTFAALPTDRPMAWSALRPGAAEIEIDGSNVRLPAGSGFDPGGIGKGLAADLVVAELLEQGVAGACVNIGGDLRVAGVNPDGEGWTVDVEHPLATDPVVRLCVADGAVATSTTLKRRWKVEGVERHHLIDPATGAPSASEIALATVVTGRAWMAEVLAKSLLLRGLPHPFDNLGPHDHALAVDLDGAVVATPGLASFTEGRPVPASVLVPAG